MVESLILVVESDDEELDRGALRSISLTNAKQLFVGEAPGARVVLHIAATSMDDLRAGLVELACVTGVGSLLTLALWPEPDDVS